MVVPPRPWNLYKLTSDNKNFGLVFQDIKQNIRIWYIHQTWTLYHNGKNSVDTMIPDNPKLQDIKILSSNFVILMTTWQKMKFTSLEKMLMKGWSCVRTLIYPKMVLHMCTFLLIIYLKRSECRVKKLNSVSRGLEKLNPMITKWQLKIVKLSSCNDYLVCETKRLEQELRRFEEKFDDRHEGSDKIKTLQKQLREKNKRSCKMVNIKYQPLKSVTTQRISD